MLIHAQAQLKWRIMRWFQRVGCLNAAQDSKPVASNFKFQQLTIEETIYNSITGVV